MQLSSKSDSVIVKKEDKIAGTIDTIIFLKGSTNLEETIGKIVEAVNTLIQDHNYKIENEL